ncbi:MAG: RluA family pseudouridine synthase [Oscillospiraceae bacterium]|nr:RluA family pseudouridine synthase [Oscillospiraceae bacterium]
MDIPILFEDDRLLLCVKPAGVLSEEGGLPGLLRASRGLDEVYCVHRLDKPAAGLMVYAKTKQAAAALSAQIAAREFEKSYLAAVQGRPEDAGVMRDLLYHDAAKNKSYVVRRQRRGVREAELRYETVERGEELSLVRIALQTGRSHQIRVQFASRGMPLAGDTRYGSGYRDCAVALWCERLRFRHPATGERVAFTATPPAVRPWTAFKFTQREEQTCDTSK